MGQLENGFRSLQQNNFSAEMECLMCNAYVYDTICKPYAIPGTNAKRAMKHANIFTPEFVRASYEDSDTTYISLMFVEAGGVERSCFLRDPIPIAHAWVAHQLKEIGDIDQIHFSHTGGYEPEVAPPPPTGALRIKIPKTADGLYD